MGLTVVIVLSLGIVWLGNTEFASAGQMLQTLLNNGAPTVVSYQGHVMVDGSSYSGTGYLKFAVVDQPGTTTYWSNDGTSTGGIEPTNAITATVSNGLFEVLLGDPTLPNMTQGLTASVFEDTDRYLRV